MSTWVYYLIEGKFHFYPIHQQFLRFRSFLFVQTKKSRLLNLSKHEKLGRTNSAVYLQMNRGSFIR